MAQAPIQAPSCANTQQPWLNQRTPGLPAATTGSAFLNGQFVIAAGSGSGSTLSAVAAANSAACWGQANFTAAASGVTPEPYTAPTGSTCFATDILNNTFWVNTFTSTLAVGTGAATALIANSRYDIRALTTAGAFSGVQVLDASSTSTNGFFKYEGAVHPDDAATDTNARVLVSIAATRQ